jgi:hypothetical protein
MAIPSANVRPGRHRMVAEEADEHNARQDRLAHLYANQEEPNYSKVGRV